MLTSDPAIMTEDPKYFKNERKHMQQNWCAKKPRGDDHHVAHSGRQIKKCTQFKKRQDL